MIRAREYFSENSLPITFESSGDVRANGSDDDDDSQTGRQESAKEDTLQNAPSPSSDSSALVQSNSQPQKFGNDSPDENMLASNPYLAAVTKISPSDLIAKFTSTAHPRVQNAVRNTILSLIGGLPKMAFDTTTITTGQRLASLMFQLQMTGYMFKNAEYRLSLQQSIGTANDISSANKFLLGGVSGGSRNEKGPQLGKIKGKLRVTYGNKTQVRNNDNSDQSTIEAGNTTSLEMEVDAAAYMSELRSEVVQLRDELMITRQEKEEALRKDLLVYIRTLPEQELRSLTNTISHDVLVAMKGLVNAVLSGIGDGQIGPDTVTEQSGEAMAQLCMWQLCIGYNLRTLEVREEMKRSLQGNVTADNAISGIRPEEDNSIGAFE